MDIQLDLSSGVPIYAQLLGQVRYLISSGRLAAGEELPPIRVLAERLVINPNTVARAYRDLEMAGLVVKRSTAGTYVADGAVTKAMRESMQALAAPVAEVITMALRHRVDLETLLEMIRSRHRVTANENGEKA